MIIGKPHQQQEVSLTYSVTGQRVKWLAKYLPDVKVEHLIECEGKHEFVVTKIDVDAVEDIVFFHVI